MMRPAAEGPQAATRHVVERPVARSVTVTTVPSASHGWAQVPAGAPYHEASPVALGRGGGGGAGVVGGVCRDVGTGVVELVDGTRWGTATAGDFVEYTG